MIKKTKLMLIVNRSPNTESDALAKKQPMPEDKLQAIANGIISLKLMPNVFAAYIPAKMNKVLIPSV